LIDKLFHAMVAAGPRCSRELTHFCSREVTQPENTI
jgi:hypothetical protein